jgi:ABC-type phosphate transport system substrate-binding protein
MFGNTFVLPHADGNITAVKINQDGYSSEYLAKSSLYEMRVRIRHTKVKATANSAEKDRHNVEILRTVYAAGEVPEYTRKVYIVVEGKPSDSDVKDVDALADWLIATANANVTSLLAWES